MEKVNVLVVKNGFEMFFWGAGRILRFFWTVAYCENAFSCGFVHMEGFNLALVVQKSGKRRIPKVRYPSDFAQTQHSRARTGNSTKT